MMEKVRFTESELVGFIEEIVIKETKVPTTNVILAETTHTRLVNWADRFERKNKDKSPDIVFENFIVEIHRLQRAGITTEQLSESLKNNKKYITEAAVAFDAHQGVLGSLWGNVREGLWNWLLRTFGIPDGLAKFVAIQLGNIDIWDIPKLLNCQYLAPFLTKGLIEYGAHQLAKATMGLDGTFEMILRNSLTDMGDDNPIYIELKTKVTEVLCGPLSHKKEQVQDVLDKNKKQKKDEIKFGSQVTGEPKVTSPQKDQSGGVTDMVGDLVKKYMGKFAQNLGK